MDNADGDEEKEQQKDAGRAGDAEVITMMSRDGSATALLIAR